ncbi:MAG: RNA-binding protein [Patescibacteria group bacterium]
MAKKLYVGGLSYDVTDAQLNEFFAQAGTVESASVIIDRMTGRSRGFGFVEMASDEDAKKAVETLNGQEFAGRTITVNEARPMADRPRGGGGGGGFGGGRGGRGGFQQRRDY